MKSFSATGLAFVPEFLRRGLAQPLHFALSYDEEVGCIGVRRLIADIVARKASRRWAASSASRPACELVLAHKGKRSWRCRVRGYEAHSSLTPRGVNAVQIACEIVAYIGERAREFRDDGRRDEAYDVPYTTAHVGVIHGGTALNIVPRDCSFDFEIRHLPFDDPDAFAATSSASRSGFLADDARGASRHVHRVRPAVHAARLGHARRQRHRRARARLQRRRRRRQGVVRHRGVPVPRRRHRDGDLRARPHRAGAPAERMGRRSTSSRAARRSCAASPTASASADARTPTASRPEVDVSTPSQGAVPPIEVAFPHLEALRKRQHRHPVRLALRVRRARDRTSSCRRSPTATRCAARSRYDWLLAQAFRPVRGTFTAVFANVEAYATFDRSEPFASRCVDEDFNRLWTAEVLDGPRQTVELARARELRPVYDGADFLLDLHSMTDPCPPLALCGPSRERARARARRRRSGAHRHRRRARRRQAAARLRVLRRPRRSAQRAAGRVRPALGARGAGSGEAGDAALPQAFRRRRCRIRRRSHRVRHRCRRSARSR